MLSPLVKLRFSSESTRAPRTTPPLFAVIVAVTLLPFSRRSVPPETSIEPPTMEPPTANVPPDPTRRVPPLGLRSIVTFDGIEREPLSSIPEVPAER